MRLRNAFKYSVLEASKLVLTKTLLLKHCYRRQGNFPVSSDLRPFRQMQLSALTVGSFLLTMELFTYSCVLGAFLLTIGAFWLTALAFLLTIELFACGGRVHVIRTLTNCKKRGSTVSRRAPTVSKKASPFLPTCFQNKSEQINEPPSADPLCKSPIQ